MGTSYCIAAAMFALTQSPGGTTVPPMTSDVASTARSERDRLLETLQQQYEETIELAMRAASLHRPDEVESARRLGDAILTRMVEIINAPGTSMQGTSVVPAHAVTDDQPAQLRPMSAPRRPLPESPIVLAPADDEGLFRLDRDPKTGGPSETRRPVTTVHTFATDDEAMHIQFAAPIGRRPVPPARLAPGSLLVMDGEEGALTGRADHAPRRQTPDPMDAPGAGLGAPVHGTRTGASGASMSAGTSITDQLTALRRRIGEG